MFEELEYTEIVNVSSPVDFMPKIETCTIDTPVQCYMYPEFVHFLYFKEYTFLSTNKIPDIEDVRKINEIIKLLLELIMTNTDHSVRALSLVLIYKIRGTFPVSSTGGSCEEGIRAHVLTYFLRHPCEEVLDLFVRNNLNKIFVDILTIEQCQELVREYSNIPFARRTSPVVEEYQFPFPVRFYPEETMKVCCKNASMLMVNRRSPVQESIVGIDFERNKSSVSPFVTTPTGPVIL